MTRYPQPVLATTTNGTAAPGARFQIVSTRTSHCGTWRTRDVGFVGASHAAHDNATASRIGTRILLRYHRPPHHGTESNPNRT